jgi:hypothetical protein
VPELRIEIAPAKSLVDDGPRTSRQAKRMFELPLSWSVLRNTAPW